MRRPGYQRRARNEPLPPFPEGPAQIGTGEAVIAGQRVTVRVFGTGRVPERHENHAAFGLHGDGGRVPRRNVTD